MRFRFRVVPNSDLPIFSQIVEQVRAGIARGALKPGDRIPTVRDLAREILVNPNTVAKAYQMLEAAGVTRTRRGAGTFIEPPNCTLSKAERERILGEKIETCLTEAVHLQLPKTMVLRRFKECAERFTWGGGS